MRATTGVLICVVSLTPSSVCAQAGKAPDGRTIHPHALAVNPSTHQLYAVDQGSNRVLIMNAAGGISSISVGKQPNALAIDAAANRIYVVNAGSGDVSVIDGATQRVVATLPTEAHPYAIAVDSSLHRVCVTNTFSNKVTVIDGTSDRASQMAFGSQDFIEVDSRRHQAFMISYEDPELTRLDAVSTVHHEPLGLLHPWGLAVDEPRGIVYVTEIGNRTLVAFHEDDGKSKTLHTGSMPDAVALDVDANRIYVANYADNTVTVADGATMKVIATLPVGTHPQALAVDQARHLVFVANTHSNNVTVIDGGTNRILATERAGANPYAVTVDAGSGNAFVANYGPHPVTKLDLSSIHR